MELEFMISCYIFAHDFHQFVKYCKLLVQTEKGQKLMK